MQISSIFRLKSAPSRNEIQRLVFQNLGPDLVKTTIFNQVQNAEQGNGSK